MSIPHPPPATTTTPPPPTKPRTCCQTVAGILGNVLEWYDFALFGYFSDIISEVFFPPSSSSDDDNTNLTKSFVIFGGAFLMRPVGGLMIGYIGDTYGRKRALTLSLFLMAFPTFLMGCLPRYDQVGWLSTVLLCIVRMLQGASVGGQLPASLVFTLEGRSDNGDGGGGRRWGLYGSFVLVAANVGTVLGNVVGATMREVLTEEELYVWGWRLPFLSGILIAGVAVYLKYNAEEIVPSGESDSESEVEVEGVVTRRVTRNPIKVAFSTKQNRRALLSVMLVSMIWGSGFYVTFVWMAMYMHRLIPNPIPNAFWINALTLSLGIILALPLFGHVSDETGRKPIMIIGACTVAAAGPLGVFVISTGNPVTAFFAQWFIGIGLSIYAGPMLAWIAESFPPEVRLTSASLGYDLAHATVAGFSPAVATLLVDRIGVLSPAVFYPFFATLSMIGLCIAPQMNHSQDGNCSTMPVEQGGKNVQNDDSIIEMRTVS